MIEPKSFKEIEAIAKRLVTEDYVKKYHCAPKVEEVKFRYNPESCETMFYTYRADDMAYYHFAYHWQIGKWEMYTFYRDGVKEWTESGL